VTTIKLSKSAIAIGISFLCLFSNDEIEIYHDDDQAPGFGMCEHGCGNKDHHLISQGDEKLNENDFRFFAQSNNTLYFIDPNPRLTLEVQYKYNYDLSFYLFGRPPPKIL